MSGGEALLFQGCNESGKCLIKLLSCFTEEKLGVELRLKFRHCGRTPNSVRGKGEMIMLNS